MPKAEYVVDFPKAEVTSEDNARLESHLTRSEGQSGLFSGTYHCEAMLLILRLISRDSRYFGWFPTDIVRIFRKLNW
jgi:hypothetical protein